MCVLAFLVDGQDTGRPPAQCPNVQSQPDVIAGGSPHMLCILQLSQPRQAVPREPAQLACARLTCVTAKREMPCAFCLWLKSPLLTGLEGKQNTQLYIVRPL